VPGWIGHWAWSSASLGAPEPVQPRLTARLPDADPRSTSDASQRSGFPFAGALPMIARMKRSLLLFMLAACGADLSADRLDIAAAPLRIEIGDPEAQQFVCEKFRSFRFRRVNPRDELSQFDLILSDGIDAFWRVGLLSPDQLPFQPGRLRLDIPVGPLRLSYGVAVHWHNGEEQRRPNLDAPGPGYREQRQRFNDW